MVTIVIHVVVVTNVILIIIVIVVMYMDAMEIAQPVQMELTTVQELQVVQLVE